MDQAWPTPRFRLRNAAGAVRAAPGRRRADPGPPALGMVRPCADAGGGHGARQYGPRSARPGARAVWLRRARSRARATTRTSFAYLRDVRQYRNLLLVEQPNGDFARTMVRQFFYAAFADLYWRAMMKSARCDAGGDRRQVGKGKRLSSAAFVGMDGPARRRHRGKPSPRAGRDRRSLGLYRRDVRDRRQRARLIASGIAVDPAALASAMAQDGFRCRERGDACAAQKQNGCSRAAAAAGTASISDICSASCNRCNGRFRVRHGDRPCTTMPNCGSAPGMPRRSVVDPEIPGSDHRRSRRAARRRGHRWPCRGGDHADLFRLPGDEHDRA